MYSGNKGKCMHVEIGKRVVISLDGWDMGVVYYYSNDTMNRNQTEFSMIVRISTVS